MLALTPEQLNTYEDFIASNGYSSDEIRSDELQDDDASDGFSDYDDQDSGCVASKRPHLVYRLEDEQLKEVRSILSSLVIEWVPLYSTYMSHAYEGKTDAPNSKYLYEMNLTQDQKLAVYLGFHSGQSDIEENAKNIVLFSMFGIIRKAAYAAAEFLRMPYKNNIAGSNSYTSYNDATQDLMQNLSVAVMNSYEQYDYVRNMREEDPKKRASYTTWCRYPLKFTALKCLKEITGYAFDTKIAEKRRILQAVLDSFEDFVPTDVEIQKRYEEEAEKVFEKTGKKSDPYKMTKGELQRLRNGESGGKVSVVSLDVSNADDENGNDTLYNVIDSARLQQSEEYCNPEEIVIRRETEEEREKKIAASFEPLELEMYRTIIYSLDEYQMEECAMAKTKSGSARKKEEDDSRRQMRENDKEFKKAIFNKAVRIFMNDHPWVSKDNAENLYERVAFQRFQQLRNFEKGNGVGNIANVSIAKLLDEIEASDDPFEEFVDSAKDLEPMYDSEDIFTNEDDLILISDQLVSDNRLFCGK